MTKSLRILLEGLVDYAGLFPPASLTLDRAIANYQTYRRGDHAWALGRFVVPASRLREVPADLPLAITASIAELRDLKPAGNPDHAWEVKAGSADDVAAIASIAGDAMVYVETSDVVLLDDIASNGLRAKIRTGGVTADAFPSVDAIAAFIRRCDELDLRFKATAGLHHPIRCVKPLTYEPDAPAGTMNGFLNVFLAAALPQFAPKILREENPRAFAFDDGGIWWHDCRITNEEMSRVRRELAISFGSCSFEEPITDLQEFGWL